MAHHIKGEKARRAATAERDVSALLQERFPDDFNAAMNVVFEILMGMTMGEYPSNDSARSHLLAAIDSWLEENGAAAEQHFKKVRPKVS